MTVFCKLLNLQFLYQSVGRRSTERNAPPSQRQSRDVKPVQEFRRQGGSPSNAPYLGGSVNPRPTPSSPSSSPSPSPSPSPTPEVKSHGNSSNGPFNPYANPYFKYYRSKFVKDVQPETPVEENKNQTPPTSGRSPKQRQNPYSGYNPFFDNEFMPPEFYHPIRKESESNGGIPCVKKSAVPEVVEESTLEQMEEFVEKVEEDNKPTPPPLSDERFANCKLYPHCEDGSNPNWAAMQIGADLADKIVGKYLNRYGSRKAGVAATVAVIDTGFDTDNGGVDRNGNPNALNALSVTIEKGFQGAGEPLNDVDGHGTAVAGTIAGKGVGVSQNLNLKLYRATEDNAAGTVAFSILDAAIEKACESF